MMHGPGRHIGTHTCTHTHAHARTRTHTYTNVCIRTWFLFMNYLYLSEFYEMNTAMKKWHDLQESKPSSRNLSISVDVVLMFSYWTFNFTSPPTTELLLPTNLPLSFHLLLFVHKYVSYIENFINYVPHPIFVCETVSLQCKHLLTLENVRLHVVQKNDKCTIYFRFTFKTPSF